MTVNGGPSTQTLTGGQVGLYQISGLPTPGDYTLSFSLAGFASETVAVPLVSNGSATGVNVTLRSPAASPAPCPPPSRATGRGAGERTDGTTTRTTITSSSRPEGSTSPACLRGPTR